MGNYTEVSVYILFKSWEACAEAHKNILSWDELQVNSSDECEDELNLVLSSGREVNAEYQATFLSNKMKELYKNQIAEFSADMMTPTNVEHWTEDDEEDGDFNEDNHF